MLIAFLLAREVGETSDRYRLDKIAETAQVTAYDIRYWTGKDAGSGYSLGELDGTYWSMIKLAPRRCKRFIIQALFMGGE